MTSDKAYALEARLNALVTSSMQNLRAASTLINSTSAIPVTNITCSMPAGNWRVHGVMYWTQNTAAVTQNWSMGGVTWTGNVQMTTFAANSSPSVPVTPTLGTTSASYMVLPAVTNGATVYATEIDGSIQVSAGGTMQVYGAEGTGGDTWTITGMFLDVWPTAIGPAVAAQQPYPVGWLNVLDYGADPTGAADSTAAIQNALNHGSGKVVYLPAGTYKLNGAAGLAMSYASILLGDWQRQTVITTGSSFTAPWMCNPQLDCVIANLTFTMPNATVSANPHADAVYATQAGAYLANVVLDNVVFYQINGWCFHLYDDGTSGAPVGFQFRNVTGSGAGGYGIFGAQRTLGGMMFLNAGLNAVGGTATNLDALYVQDAYDVESINSWFGTEAPCTGHAIHLLGHTNNMRFSKGEYNSSSTAGSGSCNIKIEHGTNGDATQMLFEGLYCQYGDIGVSLQGGCSDIKFAGCEFNGMNTHGAIMNSTGSRVVFEDCGFGTPGSYASNGQGGPALGGTYYDLNWQSSGHGRVIDCEFGSSIVAVSSAGVQGSVNFAAFAGVSCLLIDPLFSGTGTAAANQVINRPQYMRAPLIGGTAVLVGGTVTVTAAYITTAMRIGLRCLTPSANAGALYVSAVIATTSFTIKSTNAADTSTVEYEVLL